MVNLIGSFILSFLLSLTLFHGISSAAPPVETSPYTATLSPADISIQPGEKLPMTFEADIDPIMDGAFYHAEFGYSSGLEIGDIQTEPLASRVLINTRKNKVVFEWEGIAFEEGSKLNARFSVSSLTENIYTIAPLKLYFKANGKGKAINVTGNASSITVVSIPVPPPPPPPPGSYSLETIRPTDAYNPDAWTAIFAAYDNSITTYSYKDTPDSTPSISFGGNSADESINAWEHKFNNWNSAWLSIEFQKGPAADDMVEITVNGPDGAIKHSILTAGNIGISRQEFIKRLNISDWGTGFANIDDLRVRISGKKQKGSDTAESRVYDVKVIGDNAPFIKDFTKGAYTSLPLNDINLSTDYGPEQIHDTADNNSARISQWASAGSIPIQMFKFKTASAMARIKWNGQIAQSISEAFAQSFVPLTSGKINNIDIYFQKIGTPNGNLKVRIRSDLNGDVIAESHPVSETGLDLTGGWKTFSFDTPAQVVEGGTYFMEIWRDYYDANNYPEIKVMNCEAADARVWRRNAGNWTPDENNIFLSTIYIDGAAANNSQNCTYPDQYEKHLYGIEQKNIYLEIYNRNTSYWDLLDTLLYDGSKTDIDLSGFVLSDEYHDSDNWITARVYVDSGNNSFSLATDNIEASPLLDPQEISITPSLLNFETININSQSVMDIIISNTGTGELFINTVSSPELPFSLLSDSCTRQTLPEAATCILRVSFNSLSEGSFTDSITVTSDDADSPAITLALNAETVSSALTGTVTDASTSLALQGVTVTVTDSNNMSHLTYTDLYGKYSLTGLPEGMTSAVFEKGDHHSKSADISLTAGQETIYDLQMEPVIIDDPSQFTLSITSPNDGEIFSQSPATITGNVYSTSGTGGSQESLAQSFKAGRTGKLSQISLPLYRSGTSDTDKIYIRISSAIGGETLAVSAQKDFNSLPSPSYDWVNFSFEGPNRIELVSEQSYYMELWRGIKDNNNYIGWFYGSIDYYPAGERFIRDNGNWGSSLGWGDFAFKVYLDNTPDQQQLYLGLSNYLYLYGLTPYPVDVSINGAEAAIAGNSFSAIIPLIAGLNTVTATGSDQYGHTAAESITLTLQSQTAGSITGRITDSTTEAPIEGAVISIIDSAGNTHTYQSDTEGSYTINNVPEGDYKGTINKDGYNSYNISGYILSGQAIIINAALDRIMPAISNVSINSITADSAEITWTTDQSTDSLVSYGNTSVYTDSSYDPPLTESHSEQLNGLSPGTTYHFMIRSENSYGFAVSTNDNTFTTDDSPISLTINQPIDTALINRPDIMVQGSILNTTGNETGVKVNGISAIIYNGMFFANHVPLIDGLNSIIATASDTANNTASTSILVNAFTNAPHISLSATVESGITPLTTYFSLSSNIPETIVSYTLDYEGDNTIEDIGTTFEDTQITYSTEGIYYPTLTITDDKGNSYSDTIVIIVQRKTDIDALLKSKWNSMKTALAIQDISNAIQYFSNNSKAHYSDTFNALYDTLPRIVQNMQEIQLIYMKNNTAKYRISKNELYEEQNTTLSYYIYFTVDKDGIWKIERF